MIVLEVPELDVMTMDVDEEVVPEVPEVVAIVEVDVDDDWVLEVDVATGQFPATYWKREILEPSYCVAPPQNSMGLRSQGVRQSVAGAGTSL